MGHQSSSHATPLGHHAVQGRPVAGLAGSQWAIDELGNRPLSGALQEPVSGVIDFRMSTPLGVFGSGTILLYLAEKTGRLLPS